MEIALPPFGDQHKFGRKLLIRQNFNSNCWLIIAVCFEENLMKPFVDLFVPLFTSFKHSIWIHINSIQACIPFAWRFFYFPFYLTSLSNPFQEFNLVFKYSNNQWKWKSVSNYNNKHLRHCLIYLIQFNINLLQLQVQRKWRQWHNKFI